jgi:flavin reductase (DIM6/NTAB) family NADH-FMN oxidoreductase RutF
MTTARDIQVQGLNPDSFRSLMASLATGVAVLTAIDERGGWRGMTIGSFCSLSLDPPLLLACLHRDAPTLRTLLTGRPFCVNVLSDRQEHLARQFARYAEDKFAGVELAGTTADGVPLLASVTAAAECTVDQRFAAGDHVVVVGRIWRARTTRRPPLLFQQRKFHRLPFAEPYWLLY